MPLRNDIQIMRGVAVLAVLAFHLELFDNGFLGVDVFFVISGYLMAALYPEGRPLVFYDRRAERLLPAYLATVLVTLLASAAVTLPVDHSQTMAQALFAVFFGSNIGFWLQDSYFSKAAFNPLLHLWSLGVEFQFYLLVPALLFFARRHRRFLPACLALSLLACMAVTSVSPKTSFFLTPFRLWEFLLGMIIARRLRPPAGAAHARNGLAGGLSLAALLAVPLLPVDGQSPSIVSGHPGLAAVLVCAATGGILAFGLPRLLTDSLPGRMLAKIGTWSYSIYLVHFPVIVFFHYRAFSGTRLGTGDGLSDILLILMLVGALSAALHRADERHRTRLFRPRAAIFAGVAIVALATASGPLLLGPYPDAERKLFSARTDRDGYRCGRIFRILSPLSPVCEITGDAAGELLFLVGDSHADALKTSFARVAKRHGYRVLFTVSGEPLLRPDLGAEWLAREAAARDVKAVFLHFSPAGPAPAVIEQARHRLEATGVRTVLLMPVPTHTAHVPASLYHAGAGGAAPPRTTMAEHRRQNARWFDYARAVRSALFDWHDLAPALCESECRLIDGEGRPLYFDANHLTLTGARQTEPLIGAAMAALKQARIHASP